MPKTPSGNFNNWIFRRLPANTRIVERRPLSYTPLTTTEVNASRLPQIDEIRGMQLAFREEIATDDELLARTKRQVIAFITIAPVLAVVIPLIGQVIPIQWALSIAFVVGFLTFGLFALFGRPPGPFPAGGIGALVGYFAAILLEYAQVKADPVIMALVGLGLMVIYSYILTFSEPDGSPQSLLYTFIAPVGVALFGWAFSSFPISQNRVSALFFLCFFTIVAFHQLVGPFNPVTFYREWLLTHPRLHIATRLLALDAPIEAEGNRRRTVIYTLLGLIVGALYPLFFLSDSFPWANSLFHYYAERISLPLVFLLIAFILFHRLWLPGIIALLTLLFFLPMYTGLVTTFRLIFCVSLFLTYVNYKPMLRLLVPYLNYNGYDSGAAGVWIPKTTIGARKGALMLFALLFYLTAAVSMKFYAPAQNTPPPRLPEVLAPSNPSQAQETLLAALTADIQQRGTRVYDSMLALSNQRITPTSIITPLVASFFTCTIAMMLLLWAPSHMADGLRDRIEGHYRSDLELNWLRFTNRLKAALTYLGDLVKFALSCAVIFIVRAFKGSDQFPPLPQYVQPPEPERVILGLDHDWRDLWTCYVDRLNCSLHAANDPHTREPIREAEHLFLGASPIQTLPVLLHEKLLSEHCYIMGDSGSGKTALGIIPLLTQLIRGHALALDERPSPDKKWSDPPPIIILDLKGDPALFNTVKDEAASRGQKFLFFTPEKNRASHRFNPFKDFESESRTPLQLCHLLLDSLSLNHGEGYGRSYFSRRSRMILFAALNHPSKPRTFTQLYTVLTELAVQQEFKESFELISTIHALTQYPQLVTSEEDELDPNETIHMPTAIEQGQVIYFWLPAAVESISAKEIGKLAIYSLLTAAIDRQRDGATKRQIYLVIDEFQRVAGENFKIILEQARSFGLSAILSNQTINDLKTHDTDLRPTVRANTRVKMFFSVTEPAEIKLLSGLSGEEVAQIRTESFTNNIRTFYSTPASKTVAYSEVRKPRLTPADIQSLSDQPTDFILHVSRGSGYTQFAGLPNPVRALWSMNYAIYKERSIRPWPTLQTFQPTAVVASAVAPQEIDKSEKADAARRQNDVIRKLWETTAN